MHGTHIHWNTMRTDTIAFDLFCVISKFWERDADIAFALHFCHCSRSLASEETLHMSAALLFLGQPMRMTAKKGSSNGKEVRGSNGTKTHPTTTEWTKPWTEKHCGHGKTVHVKQKLAPETGKYLACKAYCLVASACVSACIRMWLKILARMRSNSTTSSSKLSAVAEPVETSRNARKFAYSSAGKKREGQSRVVQYVRKASATFPLLLYMEMYNASFYFITHACAHQSRINI